jgi:hypothetical protein
MNDEAAFIIIMLLWAAGAYILYLNLFVIRRLRKKIDNYVESALQSAIAQHALASPRQTEDQGELRKINERLPDIQARDFGSRLVLDRAQHQRDDALGDRRIAVGEEVQATAFGGRIKPDGRRAAADLGRIGLERLGHRLELPAEVDQQPVAVLGVDQPIFFQDIVESG